MFGIFWKILSISWVVVFVSGWLLPVYGEDTGTLVILPLPFYDDTTGGGLSLKILHTNLGKTFHIDIASFATIKDQQGVYFTLGQRHFSLYPRLYWKINADAMNFKSEFFGTGNDTPRDHPATYRKQFYVVTPRVGFYLHRFFRVYVLWSHLRERAVNFEDESGRHTSLWQSLPHYEYTQNRPGYGFVFKIKDSDVRPRFGIELKFESRISTPLLARNDYSYRHTVGSLAFYLPLSHFLSHASVVIYERISPSSPFYNYPEIMVRGVENSRHRDSLSYVLKNEERIYLSENWMLIPFFDIGRVLSDEDEEHFSDLHRGYGLGVRYILKNALVVRLDIGFLKNGESAFFFNYGHTF